MAKKEFIFKGIPDPFWVSGFISGDGVREFFFQAFFIEF